MPFLFFKKQSFGKQLLLCMLCKPRLLTELVPDAAKGVEEGFPQVKERQRERWSAKGLWIDPTDVQASLRIKVAENCVLKS